MDFVSYATDNKKKTRNKVPKKGTISYCKYQIAKVESSQKTRLQKAALVRQWEEKIAALRQDREDNRYDRLRGTNKAARNTINDLELLVNRQADEIAELRNLLGLVPVLSDEDANAALISAIKQLGCTLNGGKRLYDHRQDLPYPFNRWPRRRLYELVEQFIKFKKLSRLPGGLLI